MLDIGCGSGEDLLALREAGWECHGVEISGDAAAAAREAGLEVHAGDLRDARFPDASFDVVRFWHSLEHTSSPRAELEEAHRLLCPGGVAVIGVPNYGSLLSRVLRKRWFYLDVPRHLWHFERGQLVRLLEETGFRVTRAGFVSTSSPLLGSLDFLLHRDGFLANRRVLWLGTLPLAAFLDRLRLGDALEVTAVAA